MTAVCSSGARRPGAAASIARLGAGVAASLLSLLFLVTAAGETCAAVELGSALATVEPAELVPGANRFGPPESAPPHARVFEGDTLRGYVFLNTDLAGAVGYSGKPIHLLIGLGTDGTIAGYVGRNVREFLEERDAGARSLDIIAGATSPSW